jgi:hypothetical protein
VRLLYAIVLVALALLLVAFLLLVRPAWADVIDDAFRLCAAAKQTGMTSQCEVKGGEPRHRDDHRHDERRSTENVRGDRGYDGQADALIR